MIRAIKNAKAPLFVPGRILSVGAVATALLVTGCSNTTAWRAGAGALAGSLWDRSHTSQPTYDLYAQNMASRTPTPAVPSLAANDAAESGPTSETTDPEGEAKPADAAAPEVVAAEPRKRTAPTDESVRITLGRPESLAVLKESDGAAPLELADASAPRPSPPPDRPRRKPEPRPAETDQDAEKLASTEPAPAARPKDPDQKLRTILDEARRRLETMTTYQVHITRSERVGEQLQPQEDVLLSVRRKPKAVRLEWPDGPSKGREVIYSSTINEKAMFVNMANSALPIPRMTIPIDSVLAMRNSRHTIAEAGFDTIFDNLSKQLVPVGDPVPAGGKLLYKGLQNPKDMDLSCHLIQRKTPTNEVWKVYLDVKSLMPVVVTAHQEDGALLESYTYTQLQPNLEQLASADAFDPDKRWGEQKGLFSRIARAAGDTSGGSTTQTR